MATVLGANANVACGVRRGTAGHTAQASRAASAAPALASHSSSSGLFGRKVQGRSVSSGAAASQMPAARAMKPTQAVLDSKLPQTVSSEVPMEGSSASVEYKEFANMAGKGHNLVPVFSRIMSDQLTPVLAYRCLVKGDDRDSPSFLLESVVGGNQTGRYSFVGAHPVMEVVAHENEVTVLNHEKNLREQTVESDPMQTVVDISKKFNPAIIDGIPDAFCGGWVGYTSYDTVRYVYPTKIPFEDSPPDDRGVPDINLALYKDVVVFDQATKLVYVIHWVEIDDYPNTLMAYEDGKARLAKLCAKMDPHNAPELQSGIVEMDLKKRGRRDTTTSNMSKDEFLAAIATAKDHIVAGDIFQLVLSHRFERRTFADPFEVYRALRVVNPSPYMIYLQARGAICVASSPEILSRTVVPPDGGERTVVNRPLAGTRRRGATVEEDLALEEDLLADPKECAEHIMLVDLGRNDVGKVSKAGTVNVEKLMEVERYSHVMHISSTVTGNLLDGLDAWDALRSALPAGTISGAPKVRAMQIIDDLEANRRGPYGGGIGLVSFSGTMDMALALRTMVIPTNRTDTVYSYDGAEPRKEWVIHLQAGAGVVADSVPESEYEETVNKASALARAIDLAEQAFLP